MLEQGKDKQARLVERIIVSANHFTVKVDWSNLPT